MNSLNYGEHYSFSITDNVITKTNNTNPNLAVVDNLRGISLLNSANNIVASNNITKMGAGIRAFGSCPNSTLACNYLDKNFHGFKFEGPADIGYQLVGGIPTGNTWITLSGPANDIDGHISSGIEWYQNGPTIDFNLITGSFISGAPIYNTGNTICNQFQIQSPIDERENKLGKIIRNEKLFSNYPYEFNLNDKIFANRFLKENTAYLTLGSNDDTTYQNFMSQCNNNCVGKFNNVQDYIEQNDFSNALIENASIVDSLLWEFNLKRTNEIYLNYLTADSISASDSSELDIIAWQNSLTGGPGVIMARAILNLDIEDFEDGTTRNMFEFEEVNEIFSGISIYPNPSDGLIFIESENSLENVLVIVTDISGKQVYEKKINSNLNLFQLKIDLPNGIYHFQITQNDKTEVIKVVFAY